MDNWDTDDSGPKALREYAEKQKAENAELRSQLNKMQAQMRQNSIGSVLKEKGYNPKIAALIPGDVEATEEKVNEWLTTYGDVFGAKPTETVKEGEDSATTDPEVEAKSNQLDRVGAAVANELPPDKIRDLGARIDGAKDKEELDGILKSAGVRWTL